MVHMVNNASKFKSDPRYHYYESVNFNPYDSYYSGFSERQMKRIHTVFGNFANYYHYLHTYVSNYDVDDNLKTLYDHSREMIIAAKVINDHLRNFKSTDRKGKIKNHHRFSTFDNIFQGKFKRGNPVKSVQTLESRGFVKYVGKWPKHNKIRYVPTPETLINNINQNFRSFVFWGHWVDYLKNGLFECDDPNTSDNINIQLVLDFLRNADVCVNLMTDVKIFNPKIRSELESELKLQI